MSKIRKILIALLTLISAVCLTLVGCGKQKVEFVDFESKTINVNLGDILDAREYMEVYDVNGKLYLATINITDVDGEPVEHFSYRFVLKKTYYKITVTIKEGEEVIGTRELTINAIDNTPPFITLLEMADFGVYNQEVFVPISFEENGETFNKKLVVEQYVTSKVDGEYVTTLDTQNAIVKNSNDFSNDGVAFTPTKPGTYKISIYAWDEGKTELDARVVSINYSIKETSDASGEIEGFDSPDALVANYHYYKSQVEYNELRGEGQLVYVKNDAGDYLDAEGNILYKKVDEISTNNRIAFYKKADAQSTDYDVLAYYQDMTTYSFYDAEGNVAQTKEGCITVKAEDGVTDYVFNNKYAPIGEEWFQELADKDGTTKFGVIKANASQHSYSDVSKRFYFKSSYRDINFFRDYNGARVTGWLENPAFDYLSIWMLVQPKDVNEDKTSITAYTVADFYQTEIPVGEWFEFKVSKTELRMMGYYPYYILSCERTANVGGYITLSNQDYNKFNFYFDNISYVKGANITTSSDVLLMGQQVTLDVANCGELTKDDFNFYVGKARDYVSSSDSGEGMLSTSSISSMTAFLNTHQLLEGNTFTPELENGLTLRKYYVQVMLNEQGLAKNNGEQIYATKVLVVNNVNVSLSNEELGQEVTINASLDGVDGVTFAYYYKETSATEWSTLDSNVFTPSKPTSYDVKVVATVGSASVEKIITKDYTKEISLEVLPATGDSKYVINKDLTIVAELPGSIAITLEVVDSENNPVTITDGKINVSKMGVYTVTASTLYNGVAITKTVEIRVVGPADITASMVETATIGINESVEITASTDAQYTLKYSAKLPTGKVITLDGNVLPIGLVGNYEVYVTAYNGENVTCGETTLPLVVNQMTVADYENSGIIATFGYDGSEIASYKVTITDKATWKAFNTAESIATGTLSNGTQWTADWHAEYEGRYGVISTRAQIEADGAYGGNPIFLRSDIYHTTDVMLPYFGTKGSISNRKIAGIEYEGWDYISVWIYLPKENAVDGDYTEIWRRSAAGGAIQVPYNVWYELKIDKAYFINNYYERPGYVFRYGTGSYPLFFMSGKTDSADENALERDQIIYVDGIRTAKYQGEQNFTSGKFVFTDENGATTLDDVGSTPEFTVDANGNCEYYVKPINYVGETLVPIEDIKLDFIYAPYVVVTQLENGVFKITQAKLNKGAVRATYDVTMQLTYTDDNDVVYRKYYRLVSTAKIATE